MTAKDLKNALLQEAVQGRLVPQIASEGNARDLLEEIRKEKLSHGLDFANAKSGKKKSKKETASAGSNPCDITEDEIPFEIPESWCWCRLGDIINIKSGDGLTSSQMKKGNIPVFGGNGITGYHNISNIHKESIVIGRVGFYCGSVHITPNEAWVTDNAFITTYPEKQIDKRFLVYVLRHLNLGQDNNATAQPVVSGKKIYPIPFPLPPLAEQKRIVAAIEKFMPLIEEYGKKETELKALNEQIGTLTKKAILQEAVQGKLVPQIAAEGNAKDLLEEIRKEKLSHGLDFANAKSGKKKSKKETALAGSNPCDITEEEIPFDIPENWCWCRLGEICNEIKRGKSPKYADKSNFLAFAQKCNVKTGGIDLGLALYLDENSITRYSETDNLVQGDIVINSTGGGTMGRVGLYETQVPAGIKGVYPDSHVTVIRSIGNINQHYLYYVLKLNQPVLEKCGTGSTNQTELKPAVLADFVIPLPPLAEQKRIVDTIEKMLPLCEKLGE